MTVRLARVAVDQRYKDLLIEWVKDGIEQHGGQNAFARYTERFLSKFDLPGFASGVLGRWKEGKLTEGLEDDTLRRIGLLKGFSSDPLVAQKVCYHWLNDPSYDPNFNLEDSDIARLESLTATSQEPGDISVVDQIRSGTLSPKELKSIAIAAIQQLGPESTAPVQSTPSVNFEQLPPKWTAAGAQRLLDIIAETDRRFPSALRGVPVILDDLALGDLDGKLWIFDLGLPYGDPGSCYSSDELSAIACGVLRPRVSETEERDVIAVKIIDQMKALGHSPEDVAKATTMDASRVERIIALGHWPLATSIQANAAFSEAMAIAGWHGDDSMSVFMKMVSDRHGELQDDSSHKNSSNPETPDSEDSNGSDRFG
ncbi:MAG: hypothetical protein AAGB19_16980 [Cyanobacteria bacterium P01_F01_bin.3]